MAKRVCSEIACWRRLHTRRISLLKTTGCPLIDQALIGQALILLRQTLDDSTKQCRSGLSYLSKIRTQPFQ